MREVQIITPDDIDFAAYERETEVRQRVRPAKAYVAELVEQLGRPVEHVGQSLPWLKARGLFRFRPGEVTLWCGPNGSGKSLLGGFIALDMLFANQRVCIASFEMKPHTTLRRMLRQWCGYPSDAVFGDHPEAVAALRDLYEQFGIQADGRLWFYDQQGTITARQMVSVARFCAKELGIKHVFIDSLMKCVRGADDYNGQKEFVDELTAVARDYEVHIHLVHHTRKLENELRKPDKTDVKGAGEITDLVDNVLLVWRNKADAQSRKATDPDAAVICCKQRNGEWEGGINLWFDRESQQFLEAAGLPPINFAERSA